MDTAEPKEIRAERVKEHIRRLKHLLEDFSDEIPSRIIDGEGDENRNKYKIRGRWFLAVMDTIDLAITECGIEDESFTIDFEKFSSEYEKKRIDRRALIDAGKFEEAGEHLLNTKEEIDAANDLLRRLIENLQNSI